MTGYIKDVLQEELDSLNEAIGEVADAMTANIREHERLARQITLMQAQRDEVAAALQAQATY